MRLKENTWTAFPIEDLMMGIASDINRGIYAFSISSNPQVYKFDGIQFNTIALPVWGQHIYSMTFDHGGVLWLAGYNQLSKCPSDTVCDTYPGEIVPNFNAIDIDAQNNIWLGTQNGVVKFDGANFIYYTKENTGEKLGSDDVRAVKVIGNTVWTGTYSGLSSFDGENWILWEWDGEVWHAK